MTNINIQIRETKKEDFNNIMIVEERAFGYKKEAQLTADLLKDSTAKPVLSLLAFNGEEAIGHILFTRVYLDQMNDDQALMHILAPLAVIPEYQKQGIGGLLIKEGLRILAEWGSKVVFVLGHMDYYPRFGFIPDARQKGFIAPHPIPDEFANAWMVQSLNPKGILIKGGNVICSHELNKPEHWRE